MSPSRVVGHREVQRQAWRPPSAAGGETERTDRKSRFKPVRLLRSVRSASPLARRSRATRPRPTSPWPLMALHGENLDA
jgi:hypothetical protein